MIIDDRVTIQFLMTWQQLQLTVPPFLDGPATVEFHLQINTQLFRLELKRKQILLETIHEMHWQFNYKLISQNVDTTAFGARLTQDERPRDANQLVEFGLGLCISFLDTCDVLLLYCISRGLAGLKLQLVFAVYRLQVLLQVYLWDAIISHSCCLEDSDYRTWRSRKIFIAHTVQCEGLPIRKYVYEAGITFGIFAWNFRYFGKFSFILEFLLNKELNFMKMYFLNIV